MRLNLILLARFKKPVPGSIYIGKNRRGAKVEEHSVEGAIKRLQQEEENMLILRNPYLTLNQSWGHAKELGKHEAWVREKYLARQKHQRTDQRVEDHYNHLRSRDSWEV